MRCLDDQTMRSGAKWSGCYSPGACRDWGYCRNRNIEAGGMANVTPEMQAEWRRLDQEPER
jgi:hypothetical protein